MANVIQNLRSTVAASRPVTGTRAPGEIFLNFADQMIGYIDGNQIAVDLLAIRKFSSDVTYAAGDIVTQGRALWRARATVISGSAFNAANWWAMSAPENLVLDPVVAASEPSISGRPYPGTVTAANDSFGIYARQSATGDYAVIALRGPTFPGSPNSVIIRTGTPGTYTTFTFNSGNFSAPNAVVAPQFSSPAGGNIFSSLGLGLLINPTNFFTAPGPIYGQTVALVNPNYGDCTIQFVHYPAQFVAMRCAIGNPPVMYYDLRSDGIILRSSDGAQAAWNIPSDERIKENIAPSRIDAIDIMERFPVDCFYLREDAAYASAPRDMNGARVRPTLEERFVEAGFVAQRVGVVIPKMETISGGTSPDPAFPDGLHGVNRLEIIPYLALALKQTIARLKAAEAKLATLEGNAPA
jgi:hypothetical protein